MFRVNRVRILAAAVVAAASMAIAGVTAHAASASQCVRNGCELFMSGPASGYFFSTPGYSYVGMICWKDSYWYAGTNRWFYVSTIYGGGRAWVSANEVLFQTTVGHC
jgi:hypothetical protein